MKVLIFFALAFATVTPKDLYSRLAKDPVLENEGRIVNGHKATPAQFKYMVGLDFVISEGAFWCGGSLIGEKWVLSAGHCSNEALSVEVYLGATDRKCPEKLYEVPKKHIFTHPLLNPSTGRGDISLIQIPVTNESSRIKFVKIPNNDHDKYLNDSAVTPGWGSNSDNEEEEEPDDLYYAMLKVSPGNICFEDYGVGFNDDIHICVATPDKASPCKGDSGGPFVLEGENLQIGVNSYGGRYCAEKDPVVYTRVSAYRLWIFVRTANKP